MIETLVLTRSSDLEVSIPMKDDAPDHIKELYKNEFNKKMLVWKDLSTDSFGCIHNNRSVTCKLSDAKSVNYLLLKPAKAQGWVGLTLQDSNGTNLIEMFSSSYSELSKNWLYRSKVKISEFTGLKSQDQDLGYDA